MKPQLKKKGRRERKKVKEMDMGEQTNQMWKTSQQKILWEVTSPSEIVHLL